MCVTLTLLFPQHKCIYNKPEATYDSRAHSLSPFRGGDGSHIHTFILRWAKSTSFKHLTLICFLLLPPSSQLSCLLCHYLAHLLSPNHTLSALQKHPLICHYFPECSSPASHLLLTVSLRVFNVFLVTQGLMFACADASELVFTAQLSSRWKRMLTD